MFSKKQILALEAEMDVWEAAREKSRVLRSNAPYRRVQAAPAQKFAHITDEHRFASLATGMTCGDERQRHDNPQAQCDLGNLDPVGFKGKYQLVDSTKRVHDAHVPDVVEYDTRVIGDHVYYWVPRDRCWSRKPPRATTPAMPMSVAQTRAKTAHAIKRRA